jgi:hypothetical protein
MAILAYFLRSEKLKEAYKFNFLFVRLCLSPLTPESRNSGAKRDGLC